MAGMRILRFVIAFGVPLVAVAGSLSSWCQATASFDRPTREIAVDFGPSPYYPWAHGRHTTLTCFYYPGVMIKQFDMGQKGAEWLSIFPLKVGQAPKCTKLYGSGEVVFAADAWSGYFWGVKAGLVFFREADGLNGALGFAVFDSRTGKRVFAESAAFGDLQFGTDHRDGYVAIDYRKVAEADCSLPRDKTACWERTQEKLHLERYPMPVCHQYDHRNWDDASAIAYPVEVVLAPRPVVSRVPGKLDCWPGD